MELTSKDYRAIAEKIENGANYIEYQKDNEILCLECNLEIDGYEENDYNGTGAFIETAKNLYVENVESWDEEGDETSNDFDESELLSWVA